MRGRISWINKFDSFDSLIDGLVQEMRNEKPLNNHEAAGFRKSCYDEYEIFLSKGCISFPELREDERQCLEAAEFFANSRILALSQKARLRAEAAKSLLSRKEVISFNDVMSKG